jgi:cytochrome c6
MCHINSIALVALLSLTMPSFAIAADVGHGGQLFSANCAAYHMGGGNMFR